MTKNTKMLLGVAAVAAVGYLVWKNMQHEKKEEEKLSFNAMNARLQSRSIPNFNATGMGASSFFERREAMGGKFQATGRKRNATGRKLRQVMRGTQGFAV